MKNKALTKQMWRELNIAIFHNFATIASKIFNYGVFFTKKLDFWMKFILIGLNLSNFGAIY